MLSCGCDEGEGHWGQRTRTARKPHVCYECRRPIEPGMEYEFHTHFGPDYILNFKVCPRCNDLGESFQTMGFCWYFGELWAAHREYLEVYEPPKIRKHKKEVSK